VHIPKTGGTSVERLLWPHESDHTVENLYGGFIDSYHNKYQTGGLQHLTARHIRSEVDPADFKAYLKFAVVRNPWEKAVSQFSYLRERKYLMNFIGMSRWSSFSKYLKLISKKEHVQWMPQSEFLFDGSGNLIVDKVLRFENLREDFVEIANLLGLGDVMLTHSNKSERKPYATYYNAKTRALVGEMYAKDVQNFGYEFGEPDALYG
jgi:hypothetical protein